MHFEQMDMEKKNLKMNLRYLPEGPLREMFTSVKSLAAIQATKVSFLLELCTFSQPNKHVGFKRTTTLHILHSTHLCQHVVPCTIHRTATGAGNATSHPVPLPLNKGGELRGRRQASQQPPVQVGPVGHWKGTLHYRKLWCAVKVQQRRGRITTCW